MKKFFCSIFLISLAAVSFVSCEKDDDQVNAPDSLIGTAWLYDTDETVITEEGVELGFAIELDFVSASKVDANILVGGVKSNIYAISGFTAGTFDYTYSKPNVIIAYGAGEKSIGKVDGNTLTLDGRVLIRE